MRKQKKIRINRFLLLCFFVTLGTFFSLSNVRADDECENDEYDSDLYIYCDTIWSKDNISNINKIVHIETGATLVVEKGVQIKFGKDSGGRYGYLSVDGGRLVANGTQEEPIEITYDPEHKGSLIEFHRYDLEGTPSLPPSFLRYVKIYGGGAIYDDGGAQHSFLWNIIPPVYAETKSNPAVLYIGGKVHFENCSFYDNEYTDVEVQYNEFNSSTDTNNYLEIVNSNFEKSGDSYAVRSEMKCKDPGYSCREKLLLKDDWYGSPLGPTEDGNMLTEGKKISGTYEQDLFRSTDTIVDPVIIIPGIMGSASKTALVGDLVLDPILHIYDNLILSFEKNGYRKNKNLFEFPYEWRDSNIQTSNLLKQKIDVVKEDTKVSKVDLVAHSMGGLVARYYIESSAYDQRNDLNHLITLGTPHHGAPEDYLKWEAGEGFEDPIGKVEKAYFSMEAFHATGSTNLKNYIQSRVKSAQELLPDYAYLKDLSSENMRDYPNNYPRNTFLELINSADKLSNLKKVNFTNIVGKINSLEDTIKKLEVVDSNENNKWEHGMPDGYGKTNIGIKYGAGDETVPLESSKGIGSDEQIELNSTHSDLPTEAQCNVINKLKGKDDCRPVNDVARIAHILTFGVFSPIDIQIIAPDGVHWVGKNIKKLKDENQIEGSFYTGSDTANEFVTIPNPENKKYTIVTEGTGDGEYTVEVSKISEDENNPGRATEVTADITGTATTGQIEEKTANVSADKITIENTEATPPEKEMTPTLFRAEVEKYYKENLIKNKSAKNILLSGMKLIEDENNFLKMIKANPFLDKRTKKILITILERGIANQFKSLAKLIDKDKKSYDPTIKNVLIKDLKLVEGSL